MPRIQLTEDDVKAGNVVKQPGWFTFQIGDTKEKPAKTDGSTVYTVSLKVIDGPDPDMIGSVVFKTYSEKALWRTKKFFAALGADVSKPGITLDFDECKNMKVQGYLQRGKNNDNGEDTNDVSDFRSSSN